MFNIFLVLIFSLTQNFVFAKSSPKLVDWSQPQGIKRLSESSYNVDFFKLANHFQAQPNDVVCGPTTGSIVLNALRLDKNDSRIPLVPLKTKLKAHIPEKWNPEINMYTPENFVTSLKSKIKTEEQIFGQPINGKKDFGLQIRQMHKMMEAHGLKSSLRVVSKDFKVEKMREEMKNNLRTENDYVIVNYKRSLLGQEGGGHISPVGAYHQASDSFLVLDVTPSKHHWVWVPAVILFKAMQSFDTVENRGYLLVSDK